MRHLWIAAADANELHIANFAREHRLTKHTKVVVIAAIKADLILQVFSRSAASTCAILARS